MLGRAIITLPMFIMQHRIDQDFSLRDEIVKGDKNALIREVNKVEQYTQRKVNEIKQYEHKKTGVKMSHTLINVALLIEGGN